MNNNSTKVLRSTALIFAALLLLLVVSCGKSSTTPVSFPGTYIGNISLTGTGGNLDTITITQVSTSTAITMSTRTSAPSAYVLNGTVNGNQLSLNTQPFQYNGAVDTATGNGSLNGSTLTINYKFTGGSQVNNYVFIGTKQ